MKTVTSTILSVLAISLASESLAGSEVPSARLVDMYAKREGDLYVVHILADGDISQFRNERSHGEGSYKLTLDVPALSPTEKEYNIDTPFSRHFKMWPMQLEKKIYSRISIELDDDTTTVVGMTNSAHIFVKIQNERMAPRPKVAAAPPEPAKLDGPLAVTAIGVVPLDPEEVADDEGQAPAPESGPTSPGDSPETTTAESTDALEDELFFNLFPTPAREQQTLFNVSVEELPDVTYNGLRVGRFVLQPQVDASWVRGNNLTLQTNVDSPESAIYLRGRVAAMLVESEHQLRFVYEGRYRDFREFQLEDKISHGFDVNTKMIATPRMAVELTNHFIRGTLESSEFDPGREVAFSTDPFVRNLTGGIFSYEMTDRLGLEFRGSYNQVHFLDTGELPRFFDYTTSILGGTFLYNLSPLTSVFGEYFQSHTPASEGRPQVESTSDTVMFGLRGEITPLLRGTIRAGYQNQIFEQGFGPTDFRGFVADVSLTRDFSEASILTGLVGRRTSPSNFEDNGFYTSNYAEARYVGPLARNLRLTASASLFDNDWPQQSETLGVFRHDTSFTGLVGVSYFVTPLTFFSVDYRYDRRNSNISDFQFRNNAIQLMVGFGYLSR